MIELPYMDWENPPDEMAVEQRFSDLLEDIVCALKQPDDLHKLALFVKTPAIPCVMLNYKICIDFGLELHPTKYIDFNKEQKVMQLNSQEKKTQALELFLASIVVSRAVFRMDKDAAELVSDFSKKIPDILLDFIYTGKRDKYTWRASNPAYIRELAKDIKEAVGTPDLVIGSAHGAIAPGIILAEMLNCKLYFIRYSLFKRADSAPIVSENDLEALSAFKDKKVILFDEDVAKGVTLKGFAERMRPYFEDMHTASVLRHYLSSYRPEFVGKIFYDE